MAARSKRAEIDAEIARLYSLPLDEFTAARNALAAQRKKAGDREAADEARSLAKPSVSAWAVNQLFARERQRLDELLEAGALARSAQGETIAGAGASTLRKALQTARDLAEDLRRRAVQILSENGRPGGAAASERIGANLQALAFSPATAEVAERGWLDADLDPPGFEVLAGLQIAAGGERPPRPRTAAPEPGARKDSAAPKAGKEEAKARERREKEEARKREQREREEARLRERLERAESEADRAASEADFLRRKAEQSEKVLAEAAQRAEEAREAAGLARQRSERAAEALAEIREEIRARKAAR